MWSFSAWDLCYKTWLWWWLELFFWLASLEYFSQSTRLLQWAVHHYSTNAITTALYITNAFLLCIWLRRWGLFRWIRTRDYLTRWHSGGPDHPGAGQEGRDRLQQRHPVRRRQGLPRLAPPSRKETLRASLRQVDIFFTEKLVKI